LSSLGSFRAFAAPSANSSSAERLCENSDFIFVSCRSFFEIGKLVAQLDRTFAAFRSNVVDADNADIPSDE
jgi:hypothetical protein